jgi:hypothetical protein
MDRPHCPVCYPLHEPLFMLLPYRTWKCVIEVCGYERLATEDELAMYRLGGYTVTSWRLPPKRRCK